MIDIKVGDRYLCKDDYAGDIDVPTIKIGTWYDVIKVDSKLSKLLGVEFDDRDFVRYATLNDGESLFNYTFCINNSDSINNIWDFFYTEKEIRKLKLNKLNK